MAVVLCRKIRLTLFPAQQLSKHIGIKNCRRNNQVSQVTRQSDEKVLYKLKIDENTLRQRNITARPTELAKNMQKGQTLKVQP